MIRSVNSAGECHLDVVEVVGSNPTRSREKKLLQRADSISFNRKAPDKRCFFFAFLNTDACRHCLPALLYKNPRIALKPVTYLIISKCYFNIFIKIQSITLIFTISLIDFLLWSHT